MRNYKLPYTNKFDNFDEMDNYFFLKYQNGHKKQNRKYSKSYIY